MIEDSLKLLSSSEIITDKLDIIIDAFVKFYGEDRRKEIEEKFKSILILRFSSTFSLAENIKNIKQSVLREIFSIPRDKFIFFDVDRIVKFMNNEDNFIFDTLSKEDKMLLFGQYDISRLEVIKNFNDGGYPKIKEFLRRYNEIKNILKPYEELLERENQKAAEIRSKYYKLLVDEFKYLIPDEDLELFYKYNIHSALMKMYFNDDVSIDNNCFDEKSNSILNDPNKPLYKKQSIINDRMKILKNNGFEYNNYNDCLKDDKCVQFIKKISEILQEISNRKNELYRIQTIEIVENMEDYQKCRKLINERHYVDKNDSLGPFVYQSFGVSCFEPNYILDGNNLIMSPLILINSCLDEPDCNIIHELNHALEYSTLEITSSGVKNICGWDYDSYSFKQQQEYKTLQYSGITRKYELLNEYVNDRIAQEITDIMHNSGNYIISDYRSGITSSYIYMSFLLEDFYYEFKDIIIASRSNGNINIIWDNLGRDNFEALNDLTNKFYQEMGLESTNTRLAISNYLNGKQDQTTEIIKEYVVKKNKILDYMKEHLNIDYLKK